MKKILFLLLLPVWVFGQSQVDQAKTALQNKQYAKAESLLVGHINQNRNDEHRTTTR